MPRILVADDDPLQLDLRKQILEIAGYQVEIALTVRQTVRRLENAPAGLMTDLVIMDLRFPNALGEPDAQEGMALIRRIRDLGCRAPVIVLSGWPEDLYGQPEEQQVSRILLKPVRTRELLHAIRDLLA
ncbi:MAG: response regulator [Candidatus Solibacter sp.]|nr:response regulator [Candidatus Solibacter sp.]